MCGQSLRRNGAWLAMALLPLVGGGCADSISMPWDRPLPRTASGQWENPSKPFESWQTDRDECRQLATERAEQELAAASSEPPPVTWSRTTTFEQSMNRFDAGQRRDDLFARCMTDRGYRLVPRAE